jgi:hypothetical protein
MPQLADLSRALPLNLFQQPASRVLQRNAMEMPNEHGKDIEKTID